MSDNVLFEICAKKKKHVEERKATYSIDLIKQKLKDAPKIHPFYDSIKHKIKEKAPALISELKKASPSKGLIREDFNPKQIAKAYQTGGAACLSILTDTPYFQGKDDYLKEVRSVSTLPILRKDFMVDAYQIYESRMIGADCILIIMAALSDQEAETFYNIATDLGMAALIEIHNTEELDRALKFSPRMIGVNCRNLKTLNVDLNISFELLSNIPQDCIKIAESGIYTHSDLKKLFDNGYDAFLVGESLMRQNNIEEAVKKLLGKPE